MKNVEMSILELKLFIEKYKYARILSERLNLIIIDILQNHRDKSKLRLSKDFLVSENGIINISLHSNWYITFNMNTEICSISYKLEIVHKSLISIKNSKNLLLLYRYNYSIKNTMNLCKKSTLKYIML